MHLRNVDGGSWTLAPLSPGPDGHVQLICALLSVTLPDFALGSSPMAFSAWQSGCHKALDVREE